MVTHCNNRLLLLQQISDIVNKLSMGVSTVETNGDQDWDFSICWDQVLKPVEIILTVETRSFFDSVKIFWNWDFSVKIKLHRDFHQDSLDKSRPSRFSRPSRPTLCQCQDRESWSRQIKTPRLKINTNNISFISCYQNSFIRLTSSMSGERKTILFFTLISLSYFMWYSRQFHWNKTLGFTQANC
jgi:hypothetical protein